MANQIEIIIKGNSKDAVAAVNKLNKSLNKSQTAVDKTEKPTKKMATGFGDAKLAILGAVAAIGTITAISKKFIDAASDLEEETNKFNVVFKTTREEAAKMREELVNAYGMSRIEATKSLAAIQDFLVPMGLAREEATKLSGEFVKMATDLGSFNNMDTTDVMNDIKSALAGMSQPMRKYGTNTSITRLEQLALAEGMKIVGGQLTTQQKALLIQKAILIDNADAMGDFNYSIESFANQSKIMKSRISDISVEIGQILMPVVGRGIKAFNDFAGSAEGMEKIKTAVKTLSIIFQVAFKSIELGIKQLFLPVKLLVKGIQGIIDIVGVLANEGMTGLMTKGKEFFTDMKNRLANLTETFTTAFSEEGIPGVVGLGTEAMKEKLSEEFGGIKTAFEVAFTDIETKAQKTFTKTAIASEQAAKKTQSDIDKVIAKIKDEGTAWEKMYKGITTISDAAIGAIAKDFSDVDDIGRAVAASLLVAMGDAFAGMIVAEAAKKLAIGLSMLTNPYTAGQGALEIAGAAALGAAAAGIKTLAGSLSKVITSGSWKSFAQGGDFVTSGPEMIMVGDNPSGRERVTVTPEEQGMSGGIVIENMIVQAADAFDFGRQMQQFQAVTAGRL